jgi:periplasmic protein TonB
VSETEVHHGFRSLGRGGLAGIAITLVIHGALVLLVYQSQRRTAPRPEAIRDLIITKSVKFSKPREKFWLPRIVQPPEPTRPEPVLKLNENPLVTPPPEPPPPPKEAPKPEDKISKDMQRALRRAQALANAAKEEDEGAAEGSLTGTANENVQGDEYASAVHDAIHRNWNVPGALLNDAQLSGMATQVVIRVDGDGTLKAPQLRQSSGNDLYDDAALAAVRATGRVPPPPPAERAKYRKGIIIEFAGKDAPR